MFQMSMKLFDQCWPEIAARIEARNSAEGSNRNTDPEPWTSTVAEAGYVLGIAVGYALQPASSIDDAVSITVPGWSADACGSLNWPQLISTPIP